MCDLVLLRRNSKSIGFVWGIGARFSGDAAFHYRLCLYCVDRSPDWSVDFGYWALNRSNSSVGEPTVDRFPSFNGNV